MKKIINFVILTLTLLIVGYSSFAQIEWVNLPGPSGLCYTKKIEFKGDSIVLFGRTNLGVDMVWVATDRAKNWNSFQTPDRLTPTGVWFKGNYYAFVVTDNLMSTKIYRTNDLVTFEPVSALEGYYVSFISSGEYLFALGYLFGPTYEAKNYKSQDGLSWQEIFVGNSMSLSCPIFNGNTIMALEYFGIPMSVLWTSYDDGDTWSPKDTILFNPGGVDLWDDKIQWVGGSGADTLTGGGTTKWQAAGYGEINFSGPRRIDLLTVQFFRGDWYMGGFLFDNDTTGGVISGVLMKNGDPDSITYLGQAGVDVYSDHKDRIILVEDYIFLWINKTSAQGISEKGNSKFQIYPNPTTGLVNITSPERGEMCVYSMSGTNMGHFNLLKGQNKIIISSFPPGIYFLKFPGEEREVKKIIKI